MKLKLSDVKEGDELITDAGFSCLSAGSIVKIFKDERNELYFNCNSGRHYIDGQLAPNDTLIGLTKKG